MKRQGTIESLCREFPRLAPQIRALGALIKAQRESSQPIEAYTLFDFSGPALVPCEYRLSFAAFAEPNIPGDTILWLAEVTP